MARDTRTPKALVNPDLTGIQEHAPITSYHISPDLCVLLSGNFEEENQIAIAVSTNFEDYIRTH